VTGLVPLIDAADESRFGGKCVSLGRSLRAGLPVPPGYALDVEAVDSIANGSTSTDSFEQILKDVGGRAAVRSSAVGEDAKDASFAGQHVTILNVSSPAGLLNAILEVRQSAHSASALKYRERMSIAGEPRIAVAIQRLVHADAAGVLFTRNPATGARERLIEAAWGLGEIVVSGAVVPDSYRLTSEGRIVERTVGMKDIALRISAEGGTTEIAVEPALIHTPVLDDSNLAELHQLTLRCEQIFGEDIDIEWAFESGSLYLLQCRSITTVAAINDRRPAQ
jgi:pyruvate, water dikinase